MIISQYPNEQTMVNSFVEFTFTQPLSLTNGEERRMFIWGYEVWLPEGKSKTKSGSIDLVGTDEQGDVWLIEAKLCTNPELSTDIWKKQIDPYRISISKRSESEIAMSARRFLNGGSAGAVNPPFLRKPRGLLQAFEQWSEYWGMPKSHAKDLYHMTLKKIQSGSIISTVLADVADNLVWNSRYSSFGQGGFSYIVFNSTKLSILLDYHSESISIEDSNFSGDTWIEFQRQKKKVKPTPSNVEFYLADNLVDTYHYIIESLKKIGWNGKADPNTKAFAFNLATKYGVPIRIHIGWVDGDGSLDIKFRTPYNYGLKFNIDFRYFKEDPNMKEICYSLVKRLVKEARYNGRNAAAVLNKRDLNDHEYDSWDGEMYRMIDKYNRDYIGREEEINDLEGALQFLKDIIENPAEK